MRRPHASDLEHNTVREDPGPSTSHEQPAWAEAIATCLRRLGVPLIPQAARADMGALSGSPRLHCQRACSETCAQCFLRAPRREATELRVRRARGPGTRAPGSRLPLALVHAAVIVFVLWPRLCLRLRHCRPCRRLRTVGALGPWAREWGVDVQPERLLCVLAGPFEAGVRDTKQEASRRCVYERYGACIQRSTSNVLPGPGLLLLPWPPELSISSSPFHRIAGGGCILRRDADEQALLLASANAKSRSGLRALWFAASHWSHRAVPPRLEWFARPGFLALRTTFKLVAAYCIPHSPTLSPSH